MNSQVSIREYGCLAKHGENKGLDLITIDEKSWLWLKDICLNKTEEQSEFLRLISRNGQECLQVRNYVGTLETPSGLQIEIVPKIAQSHNQSLNETRALLWKILSKINNIPFTETEEAHFRTTNKPIIEVLIFKFLTQVNTIVKRGIRNDYVRVQEEQRFLRGKLNIVKQIRRPPSQRHLFDIEYDKYISNRAENRLIHSALKKALSWSRSSANQRLARELLFTFDSIPCSKNIKWDFSQWRTSRDMVYYQSSKPWCQLILSEQSPFFSSGKWQGVSLLFPMEQLFEKYVARQLNEQIDSYYTLIEQACSKFLVSHSNQDWFQLKPDMLIKKGKDSVFVLDTKWKLLDSRFASARDKYKIAQSDMYQLFAYGEKYLNGNGEVFLIYPKHDYFNTPLELFEFTSNLRLWVIPYDLNSDQLLIHDDCEMHEIFKLEIVRNIA